MRSEGGTIKKKIILREKVAQPHGYVWAELSGEDGAFYVCAKSSRGIFARHL